jgi:hypothetical protein
MLFLWQCFTVGTIVCLALAFLFPRSQARFLLRDLGGLGIRAYNRLRRPLRKQTGKRFFVR